MDFDGDGRTDVISGSYMPGDLYLFRRAADGKFAAGEKILDAQGNPLRASATGAAPAPAAAEKPAGGVDIAALASVPFATDWDGDGDLDLVVGNIEGKVKLIPNEGSRTKPVYRAAQGLAAGEGEIKVNHGDAGPCVADWDGDGLKDLIVGTGAGSVLLFRNTGTATKPVLAAAVTLVEEAPQPKSGALRSTMPRPGMRVKPCVADFDGDGRLDLLVGDWQHEQVLRPTMSEAQKALYLGNQEKQAALSEEYQRQRKELAAAPKDETPEAKAAREAKVKELSKSYSAQVAPLTDVAQYLSEEEKPLHAKAKAAWEAAMKEYSALANVPKDETPEAKAAREAKVKAYMPTYTAAAKEAHKYDPVQHVHHGFVWLYRRVNGTKG